MALLQELPDADQTRSTSTYHGLQAQHPIRNTRCITHTFYCSKSKFTTIQESQLAMSIPSRL